ncbi:hypothetical protein E2C01_027479 [Portunus trituberculatus]|uniref:Uncharacterized protein n=1 Tax=Portunus trituberculatus TaxID=210409 RepID=A0A5B7EI82_PORTR|nr:hypothetical protein [Portunus trituberculatus]
MGGTRVGGGSVGRGCDTTLAVLECPFNKGISCSLKTSTGGSEGEPVMVVSTVASDTLDSFSRGVMALLMILPPLIISPDR